MQILVVEDEDVIALWVEQVLAREGYDVTVAPTIADARAKAVANGSGFGLVLLDLNLPDGSGIDFLSTYRQAGHAAPVIIMTSRDDEQDIVTGLNAGADDYVVKPVSEGVLLARVRAALRRTGTQRGEALTCGNLTLDRLRRTVMVADRPVALTPKEFALLEDFLLHPGEPLSRTALLEHIWGMHFEPGTNVVDATMSRLRQKLTEAGANANVRSIRGVGFTLTCDA